MSVDDILDGFVRDRFLHFLDDGRRRHFTLRRFKKNDVILHLDSNTSITAGDEINAVAEFLRSDGGCRGRTATACAVCSLSATFGSRPAPACGLASSFSASTATATTTAAGGGRL